jgi:plastocyanin
MRALRAVALAAVTLWLVGAGGVEVVVVMSRHGFDPPTVEVARGTTVTFHRRDAGPGTYRIGTPDGSIESWGFEQYTQWSHRFDQPGTYELIVHGHPDARVEVRVR